MSPTPTWPLTLHRKATRKGENDNKSVLEIESLLVLQARLYKGAALQWVLQVFVTLFLLVLYIKNDLLT